MGLARLGEFCQRSPLVPVQSTITFLPERALTRDEKFDAVEDLLLTSMAPPPSTDEWK